MMPTLARAPRLALRSTLLSLAVFTSALACGPTGSDTGSAEPPAVPTIGSATARGDATLVVLVRHAERSDELGPGDQARDTGSEGDPGLSVMGAERAALVARMLADARFDHVWTTDFTRTRETAAPTAEAAGLELEVYDPRDLGGFGEALVDLGGRHLVVGHSNTTGDLVAELGGNPGSAIDQYEYDRLYIVTISTDGTATTTLVRFGTPFGS